MSSERAVIYVESGTTLAGFGSLRASSVEKTGGGNSSSSATATVPLPNGGGSNYVIKIQIGEETMFNPVRIDVSAGKVSARGGMIQSKESPCGSEDSPLDSSSSSGQSSPRSDMTPPPRINAGANRFGSETSESDTESDISSEFRPLSCQAAQFAMREICEVDTPSPPLPRSIMKKPGSSSNNSKAPPLPLTNIPKQGGNDGFMSLIGVAANNKISNGLHQKLAPRTSDPTAFENNGCGGSSGANNNRIIGKIISLSEAMAQKRAQRSMDKIDQRKILVDESGFHVNEIHGFVSKAVTTDSEESLSNFAGYKDIFARTNRDGTKQILSDRGTIRGVKNRVRDGIATFLQSKDTKTYSDKEQGRVVVYVTSMGVVRDTFMRCHKVKQILRNLLVKFDERDCYMNRSIQNEIRQRLPQQQLALPQVFLEGQLLGDAEVIEKLNETGELRDLLKPYKSLSVLSTCDRCGGFRMLPCPICNGSKKSVHRNHFTTEFIALKCMHCDPSGLVQCDLCNAPDS